MFFVWIMEKIGIFGSMLCFVMLVLVVVVGLLMVSNFCYFSFKLLLMG